MPFDGMGFQAQRSVPRFGSGFKGLLRAACDAIGLRVRARIVPEGRPAVVSTDEVVLVLRTARALIEPEHKWIRGHYRRSFGRYCAVGALRRAARMLAGVATIGRTT